MVFVRHVINICVMVNKMVVLVGIMHNNLLVHVQLLFLSHACMRRKGLRNCVDVCLSVDQKILKQLNYAVIRSEKGTITTRAIL